MLALAWAAGLVVAGRAGARRRHRVCLTTRLVMADAGDHDPGGGR